MENRAKILRIALIAVVIILIYITVKPVVKFLITLSDDTEEIPRELKRVKIVFL